MFRERVSDNIYVFSSDLYAQVTAGVVVTSAGGILVDSLPFPGETRELASFIPKVCPQGVKYVILTHYHADHAYGTYLFPEADVVSHELCRRFLQERGYPALEEAKAQEPLLEDVKLRLPDITFAGEEMALQIAGQVILLIWAPGHTLDLAMVYIENDQVLFASDTMMPVPSVVDGDVEAYRKSLEKIKGLEINNVVQGHGEVVLVGEVNKAVDASLGYLDAIEAKVKEAIESGEGKQPLLDDNIESTGLSRLPLHGQVQRIHVANLIALYDRRSSQ
ncbi:MAG: MBL fold metallo-hydrolase [Anaerolineae bacterium]|jgi:glyoxylase-like metal-dependent hydrolase (beta-lactamase superfamily II)